MNQLARDIYRWRQQVPLVIERDSDVLASLMMVVTELAEAAEAVRNGQWENFHEELADTMIRLLGLCGRLNVDIEREVAKKMEKNRA